MKYFGTLWQKLRRKIVIPPSPPLLSINFFSLPATSWNTEWFPGKVFSVLWDKEIFDKTAKLPPSFAWNFSRPEIVRNTENHRHWETKNFRRKIMISPPLIHNIFRYRKFCETKKGSPTKFFGTVRQQSFYGKSLYSPLRHKVSRYAIFSETQTGSSTKIFATVRQIFFNRKSWHPFA